MLPSSSLHLVRAEASLSLPSYGCAVSHVLALLHFLLYADSAYAIVLEDDFQFLNPSMASMDLNYVFNVFGRVFDVFLLHYTHNSEMSIEPYDGAGMASSDVTRILSARSCAGYVVTRRAAWQLLLNFMEAIEGLFPLLVENANERRTMSDEEGARIIMQFSIDVHWQALFSEMVWLAFVKPMERQAAKFSDVVERYADYEGNGFGQATPGTMQQANQQRHISAILMGGLGNQLCIMATVICYASLHNFSYSFEYSDSSPGFVPRSTYFDTLLYTQRETLTAPSLPFSLDDEASVLHWYEESHNEYRPLPVSLDKHLYLHGYFQNYLYFEPAFSRIYGTFLQSITSKDKDLFIFILTQILNAAAGRKTVAVHVRRGDDYARSPDHFFLPVSYYLRAVRHMDGVYGAKDVFYVIFSNDIPAAQAMLEAAVSGRYILVAADIPDYLALILMVSMKHGAIIANSIFGWWGAYLMDVTKNLPIVAPRIWLNDGVDQVGRRLLPHWTPL